MEKNKVKKQEFFQSGIGEAYTFILDTQENTIRYHGENLDEWEYKDELVKSIKKFLTDEGKLTDLQLKHGFHLRIKFNTCAEDSPLVIDNEEVGLEYKSELLYYMRIMLSSFLGNKSEQSDDDMRKFKI